MQTKQQDLMDTHKLIRLSADVVRKYLTSIIDHHISPSYFYHRAKNALAIPIC